MEDDEISVINKYLKIFSYKIRNSAVDTGKKIIPRLPKVMKGLQNTCHHNF